MFYVAPAGTPIHIDDISRWIYRVLARDDVLEKFRAEICNKYQVKHCFFVSSGRASLFLLLQCLYEISGGQKNEVIIPSYTCYSVPGSVAKAGLKIRICDIDPNTLSYNLDHLSRNDMKNVLCIVTANLYGVPDNLVGISRCARDQGVYLIDDAAQCMDGMVAGQYSGTFGDAGIYSLDKGKNITSIQGGIIVTNSDELAESIHSKINVLPTPSPSRVISYVTKLLTYATFLNPSAYWIPAKLSFLNLGATIYTTEYPIEKYSKVLGTMGLLLFQKIDEITRHRIKNAQLFRERLYSIPLLHVLEQSENIKAVYSRFPIFIQNKKKRDQIVKKLREKGIGASASYPKSVIDIKEIHPILNEKESIADSGRLVAEQIITLPTHSYVTMKYIDMIVSIIKQRILS